MILISDEKRHFIFHVSLGLLSLLQLTECEKVGLVGPSRCSGRVEVFHQDNWGTVCDDQWSITNAEVLCRELNCGTAVEAKKGAFFGQGKDEIWLDDVQCTGQESSILKCQHRPFGQNNCGHNKDAGVICSEYVRFVNGTGRCNGRVEVYHEGNWKRVCSDWGKEAAQVVCREAGCGDPVAQTETLYFGEARDLSGVKTTCSGNETSVSQCSLLKVNGSCDDATVVCGSSQPIRLVNGTNRCSGRVEIYYREQWRTVCDDRWGMQEAIVACREMNCGNALEVKYKAYFGRGQDQIWLDDIECTGHEKSLADCSHRGFEEHDCDHSTGLVCSETVRLINGTDGCSGRVEVFHDGRWGKVCKNNWGLKEATVVCKELNCGAPKKSQDSFCFGESSLRGFTSRCSGNVSSISQCQLQEHTGSCEGVSLACAGRPALRLVNGPDRCSGRVEILHDGQWGTVCSDEWGFRDAQVVCRAMDCGPPQAAKTGAFFGEGQGVIWLDDVNCLGNETSLVHCRHRSFGDNNCDHGEDAGVICSAVRLINGTDMCSGRVEVHRGEHWSPAFNVNWGMNEATVACREMNCGDPVKISGSFGQGGGLRGYEIHCNGGESSLTQCAFRDYTRSITDHIEEASVVCSGNMRLTGGSTHCDGRVEYFNKGQWGTVCAESWDMKDATVVCRQLDCGRPHKLIQPGPGTRQTWTDHIECNGMESTLTQCPQRPFSGRTCNNTVVAGIFCTGSLVVRLVNSNDECSGRVEVRHGDQWQTVCDTDWTLSKAEVVCELLECGRVVIAHGGAFFGRGSGSMVEASNSCFDSVTSLQQCSVNGFTRATCEHEHDAGVLCAGLPALRLVNGTNRCSGRVEILHHGQWGTVCDDEWDFRDAQVVCRAMDCGPPQTAKSGTFFGEGQGVIWLDDVSCLGNEMSLMHCRHRSFGENDCRHGEDAGVICSAVRLINGTDMCSGRVEVHRGEHWSPAFNVNWGMSEATVVCREMNCGDPVKISGSFSQGGDLTGYEIHCNGGESSLTQCTFRDYTRSITDHIEEVSVVCSGNVRLTGGSTRCDGRVEYFDKGQWGTVCAESWDMNDTTVVCRQLDCGRPHKLIQLGPGTGQTWTDQIECNGMESTLTQCPQRPFTDRTCDNTVIVGVFCTGSLAVRLVNSNDECSGRVEVRHGDQWQTVCDTDWTLSKAAVVCELLECGRAVSAHGGAFFGRGSGSVVEATNLCFNNVTSLQQCSVTGFTSTTCKHEHDAGVLCAGRRPLRLVNGPDRCSGRVEILHDGQWGTVCSDEWGFRDAQVVCRAMDCGPPQAAKSGAFFGEGQGVIWLDDVNCLGNETSLMHCRHRSFGENNCGHDEDAGVICSAIRLINGTDMCSGRVEVHRGEHWSLVFNVNWGMSEATVVCREMNCGDPVKISGSFGRGGDLTGYEFHCNGGESSLTQCTFRDYTRSITDHIEEASVVCSGRPPLRLVNGTDRCSGRVEILHGGQWGTVCDDEWDFRDAQVVCRAMDCGPPQTAKSGAFFGEGQGVIWLDDVNCLGNEMSLVHCQHRSFGENNCGHDEDAGAICSAIRLINGTDMCSGRVEVHHGEHWSPAFNVNWGMNEATVVCREMNCGDPVKISGSFGRGGVLSGYEIHCNGGESSLTQCTFREYTRSITDHIEEASVVCSGHPPLRLVNGPDRCSGRVEILHDGQWGTVCDDEWDFRDAQVVCRAMDCGPPQAAKSGAFFGEGQGVIWLDDVNCLGNETSLVHCRHRYFGENNCRHGEDAGVICSAIRLTNGTDMCSGRVEVHRDEHWSPAFNVNWGMSEATVACREMNCGDPVKIPGSFGRGGVLRGYELHCNGGESSLTQCTFRDYTRSITDHIEEASVVCLAKT